MKLPNRVSVAEFHKFGRIISGGLRKLETLEQNGPFIGIVGFSSGAAITAIIASLLEKRGTIYGITLRVPSSSCTYFASIKPHG
jgi:acetyl esterase/lipase